MGDGRQSISPAPGSDCNKYAARSQGRFPLRSVPESTYTTWQQEISMLTTPGTGPVTASISLYNSNSLKHMAEQSILGVSASNP